MLQITNSQNVNVSEENDISKEDEDLFDPALIAVGLAPRNKQPTTTINKTSARLLTRDNRQPNDPAATVGPKHSKSVGNNQSTLATSQEPVVKSNGDGEDVMSSDALKNVMDQISAKIQTLEAELASEKKINKVLQNELNATKKVDSTIVLQKANLDQLFDLLINRQTNRVTTAKITFAISDIFYYDPDSDLRTLLGILTDGLKDNLRKLQIQQARCDRLGSRGDDILKQITKWRLLNAEVNKNDHTVDAEMMELVRKSLQSEPDFIKLRNWKDYELAKEFTVYNYDLTIVESFSMKIIQAFETSFPKEPICSITLNNISLQNIMQLEYIDFILDSLVSTDFYIDVNLDDLRKLMKETNSRIKRKIMKFGPHLEKQCGDVSSSDLVEKLRKLRESLGAVDVANHQLLSGNLDRLAIRIKNFLTETFNKKFDDTKIVDRLQRLQAAADAEDKNVKTTRSCLELESFLTNNAPTKVDEILLYTS